MKVVLFKKSLFYCHSQLHKNIYFLFHYHASNFILDVNLKCLVAKMILILTFHQMQEVLIDSQILSHSRPSARNNSLLWHHRKCKVPPPPGTNIMELISAVGVCCQGFNACAVEVYRGARAPALIPGDTFASAMKADG